MPDDTNHDLEPLRKRIDDLDEQIVRLLTERAKVVVDVGEVERVLDVDSYLHHPIIKKRREHGRDQTREVVPLAHLVVVVVALVPIDEGEGVDEDEEQHAQN